MTSAHAELTDPRAYVRLAETVRQQLIAGTLKPGQPAPSITRLSQEHGHARPTCGEAMRVLEREGLLTRIPGLGYYVKWIESSVAAGTPSSEGEAGLLARRVSATARLPPRNGETPG